MLKTQAVFKNFYKKDRTDITNLVQTFVENDFFVHFPKLKHTVAILITGSVASGFYDSESDINVNIIFPDQKSLKSNKKKILDRFRDQCFRSLKKPIEIDPQNITYFQKLKTELESWEHDWMLREFADAIIIRDPNSEIEKLKEKMVFYPKDVYQEKIESMFAEASYLLLNRYKTGMKRNDIYYTETVKFKILRILMAGLIMGNHQYPTPDRHLYHEISKIKKRAEIKKVIDQILRERNSRKAYTIMTQLWSTMEKELLKKKLIKKEDDLYWIGFRPKRHVEVERV